jgi:hypothetical protein
MFARLLLTLALLFAAAPAARAQQADAQQHPDFSGTWKLNLDKSDYGDLQGPDTRTDIIEQRDGHITERVTAAGRHRTQQYTLDFATDGTSTALPPDTKMGIVVILAVSSRWQGSALIVTQNLRFQGAPLVAINRYTLSADANTLTIALAFSSDSDPAATFVFDRVPADKR